ncbi:RNA-binding S4 domain-containing protein [Pseudoalteromonas denitrificans]|uniref:Ribosome-associated protein n=1 Tax=Pseudoalteromonas denitrificans DSM 6059 TaxID=1123010 RepID=A0A1I1R5A8_9GAMM|nr:RNA-binding S4 domain-containing protein [Pseudoalteromonas denitrificans]SFD29489.1 ribosome-associated protein [Pseudoalteromonas denitrificans DSM 6059]
MSDNSLEIVAEVELQEEPIELCNLLQILDLVESGGQAKTMISEGYVGLNDEVCTQKRRKVFGGDILNFGGNLYQISLAEDGMSLDSLPSDNAETTEPETVEETKLSKNAKSKLRKKKNKAKNTSAPTGHRSKLNPNQGKSETTGRKPISFG